MAATLPDVLAPLLIQSLYLPEYEQQVLRCRRDETENKLHRIDFSLNPELKMQ